MPWQSHKGVIMATKIRKRGCSSPSSRIHNYRFNKRVIRVGKNRVGLQMESRSRTPFGGSPRYSQSGKSTQPVSARRLAATLWELNETPSCKMSVSDLKKNGGYKMDFEREKMQCGWGFKSGSGLGSVPPHLMDPSHGLTGSEMMDRYRASSHHRRTPSISQKLKSADQNAEVLDSMSHASFMETESRSRPRTPSGSVTGSKNRLKDASSALTTSKELLNIINRVWAHVGQPSSNMSLISALHSEIERARRQVNQLIQEQYSDKNEVNYLVKCFSEERASWKNKEKQRVEIIAGELEMERKLRRQLESLNKKLGQELAEIKSSFMKAVKELESEKRAREVTEQACDELERNINEDRVQKKRESVKVHEDFEKERKRLELAEAKHHYEEKNTARTKLRKQLDVFLATKKDRDEGRTSYFGKSNIGSHQNEQEDDGEVDDAIESIEDSAESDLHSIQLNMDSKSKYNNNYTWDYTSAFGRESRKSLVNDEMKARKSISGQDSRRRTSLLRTLSGGLDQERLRELENEAQTRNYLDGTQRCESVKGRMDQVLLSSRLPRSPSGHRDPSWPLRDHCSIVPEISSVIQETSMKARMLDARGEGKSISRSKW